VPNVDVISGDIIKPGLEALVSGMHAWRCDDFDHDYFGVWEIGLQVNAHLACAYGMRTCDAIVVSGSRTAWQNSGFNGRD
jgi:hypothetical protein